MTYIVFVTILLLITLLGSYLVVENNRKKAIEAKKKLFNDRVAQTHTRLKIKLNELLEAKVIRPKYIQRFQAIVGNFFVVQAHTEENLQKLEAISSLLINTLSAELIKVYQNDDRQAFADRIQYFVAELPQQGILYNKSFYHDILPALITTLHTEENSQDTDINSDNDSLIVEDTKTPPAS
jgi:hypothetical protein